MATSDTEQFVEQVVDALVQLIDAQIEWHLQHGSTGDKDKLLKIAAEHVAEILDHRTEQQDKAGKTAIADALDDVHSTLLPEAIKRVQGRL